MKEEDTAGLKGEGDVAGGSDSTHTWLRNLQRSDPASYREVFGRFKNVANGNGRGGGRGHVRPSFNPRTLVQSETVESCQQARMGSTFEAMDFKRSSCPV